MQEWYSENGLKMNSYKTQCIFLQHQISTNGTRSFQITIDGRVNYMEDKVKSQGVIFDSCLSFEHRIILLCSRLNETLSYLHRVKYTPDHKFMYL